MSNFEKASRLKLRFATTKGNLSVEDLWDLPLTVLNELAKTLSRKIKTDQEEDFLRKKPKTSIEVQLAFDITKYIIDTKLEENEIRRLAKEKREKKQKILELINKKQDEALGEKSIEELEKELEDL